MSEPSKLLEMLDITRHSTKESSLLKEWGTAYHEILSLAYGFRVGDTGETINQITRDAERHELGSFTNTRGETVNLRFSVAESRKRWMERQDDTLISSVFANQHGLAYTHDMERAIYGLLTPEDKEFVRLQLNLYNSVTNQIDEVYQDIYGPSFFSSQIIPGQYSPTLLIDFTPQGRGGIGFRYFQAEVQTRREIHRRADSGGDITLRQSSDTEVLFDYFKHAAHFIAWEKQLREWGSLFVNKGFTDAITTKYGENLLTTMRSILEDIKEGRKVYETTLWTATRKCE